MKQKQIALLTKGEPWRVLLKMTLPMMVGMVGMVLFNLVDAYYVSRLGTQELAAMSFTFPVVLFQGSISMGLGVGAAAVISRLIGEGDHQQVKKQTTDSLLLALLIVIVFAFIGIITINSLFSLLGASADLLPMIHDYMLIWYCGVIFVVIPMIGNNAIRATGNTVIPSLIMIIAIVINIILDPLLMFESIDLYFFTIQGAGLGLKGAAIATVAARMTTCVSSLLILFYKFDMITLRFGVLGEVVHSWRQMLHVGIPAAITQLSLPLAMGVITRLIAGYGDEAVAAFGVGGRIEIFILSPVMALSSVLMPFVGQNSGAFLTERIKSGIRSARKIVISYTLVLALLLFFSADFFSALFISNPLAVQYLSLYLRVSLFAYLFLGLIFIHSSFYNAVKRPQYAALIQFSRLFLLYIPLAFLLQNFYGLSGVFIASTLSACGAGLLSLFWVDKELRGMTK